MMANTKANLLQDIHTISFAIDDVKLFLDTHPENQQALGYYHHYVQMRKQLLAEYAEKYGPLLVDDVNVQQGWTWVDGPWPWQMEEE